MIMRRRLSTVDYYNNTAAAVAAAATERHGARVYTRDTRPRRHAPATILLAVQNIIIPCRQRHHDAWNAHGDGSGTFAVSRTATTVRKVIRGFSRRRAPGFYTAAARRASCPASRPLLLIAIAPAQYHALRPAASCREIGAISILPPQLAPPHGNPHVPVRLLSHTISILRPRPACIRDLTVGELCRMHRETHRQRHSLGPPPQDDAPKFFAFSPHNRNRYVHSAIILLLLL